MNIVVIVLGGMFLLVAAIGSSPLVSDPERDQDDLDIHSSDYSPDFRQPTPIKRSGLSGVYLDGGWLWDFRSNGTVQYTGDMGGISAGFEGTYSIRGGVVSVVLENGKTREFEVEGSGDLTSQGERLPRVR